jgi:hypothetical protein
VAVIVPRYEVKQDCVLCLCGYVTDALNASTILRLPLHQTVTKFFCNKVRVHSNAVHGTCGPNLL